METAVVLDDGDMTSYSDVDSPCVKALGAEGGRSGLGAALCITVTLILHRRRRARLDADCREDRMDGRVEEREREREGPRERDEVVN